MSKQKKTILLVIFSLFIIFFISLYFAYTKKQTERQSYSNQPQSSDQNILFQIKVNIESAKEALIYKDFDKVEKEIDQAEKDLEKIYDNLDFQEKTKNLEEEIKEIKEELENKLKEKSASPKEN